MTDDLLEIALHLAQRETGRPKTASLRRAVSSAYYALFHALAWLCAARLVGEKKGWALRSPIYRSLDHRKTLDVLKPNAPENRDDPRLRTVSFVFKVLQDARHNADYNPETFAFDRSATLDLIEAARRAIGALNAMPKDDQLALAVRLIARTR